MTTTRATHGPVLHWTSQGETGRGFTLGTGDTVLAVLGWAGGSGLPASVRTAAGSWRFEQRDLSPHRGVACLGGNGSGAGMFQADGSGQGILALARERAYLWRHASFCRPEWAFVNPSGDALVRLRPRPGRARAPVETVFHPAAMIAGDALLLAALGFYLLAATDQGLGLAGVSRVAAQGS